MMLPALIVEDLARAALLEDLGRAGDITTLATVPEHVQAEAALVAREPGVIAGIEVASATFRLLQDGVRLSPSVPDSARVEPGDVVARVSGPARGILTGERVALNFLGRMSGIATATRAIADAIAHTRCRVTCTRKTTPGLRVLEKYAVRCGGGANHRYGLDDAMLIKDNHIAIAGGVRPALARARAHAGHLVKIEIEVDTLPQLEEALVAGADVVLLDNMSLDELRIAVKMASGRAITEASGGITLEAAAEIAETGVDLMAVGWITHSARCLDIGLDI